jgi:hypothetical protein
MADEYPIVNVYGGTSVTVYVDHTEVILPSGYVVTGYPSVTQSEIANKLGYGGDLLAMVRDHDPMHAQLCDLLDVAESYSLRKSAGVPLSGQEQILAGLEEDAVLAVLKFKRHHEIIGDSPI